MNSIKNVILNVVKNLSGSAAARWLADTLLARCTTRMVALCSFLCLLASCEHRPLEDPSNKHFIRVYFDEHLKNVTYGFYDESRQETDYTTPQVLGYAFYDPLTGRREYQGYLQSTGSDERGNYIEGYVPAIEGKYDLLINKFDTKSTHLKDESVFDDALVYTNPVSDDIMRSLASARATSDAAPDMIILNEPDHYFVASEESMLIKETLALDTLKNAEGDFFTARSVVKTYYLQINVKGAEYVTSASGYLTGLAGSVYLADRRLNEEDESCIYFQLKSNHTTKRSDVSQAYCTFNTFGKLPASDGRLIVVFEFKTKYGTTQVEKIELNDLFETDMVKIEITPDANNPGGMQPSVGNWGQVEGDITI